MMNVSSIYSVDTCTTKAIAIIASSSAGSKKRYNSRTYSYENSNEKLFKCFVLHT